MKFYILCPAAIETGGPEALHMLAGELRLQALDAVICYLPLGCNAKIPRGYAHYGAVTGEFKDEENSVVIAPEIYPQLLLSLRSRNKWLWWLSLSNYYNRKQDSQVRDSLRYFRLKINGSRPWSLHSLKRLKHLSQSNTVTKHLFGMGISTIPLTDYINPVFLDPFMGTAERTRDILFNEKKSSRLVKVLANMLPDYRFVGLSGLNPYELRNTYRTARLFVDFGNHPGKDRMPREAVSQGCTLITGMRGTAGDPFDLPIPSRFKVDENEPNFVGRFREACDLCIDDYQNTFSHNFIGFQAYTQSERALFRRQLTEFVGLIFSEK